MKRFFILVLILQIHFALSPCTIYGAINNGADGKKTGNVTTLDNEPDFYYDGSTPLKYWTFYAVNQEKKQDNNKDVYVLVGGIMSNEEANKLNISLQNYTKLSIPGEFDCEGTRETYWHFVYECQRSSERHVTRRITNYRRRGVLLGPKPHTC